MFTGERQVQRAQSQHGGEEHDPHDAEVDEQADPHTAEQEGPQRLPPEGAMDEVEGDHEGGEEGDVLRVEEGVRVDARVQQEQRHRHERQQPVAEQPQREQVAADAARQEKQVREEVSGEMNPPAVLDRTHPHAKAGDAFDERQRRLENRAIPPVRGAPQLVEGALAVPQEVVERRVPDVALGGRVPPEVVVVERERAHAQEERGHSHERPVAAQAVGDAHTGMHGRNHRGGCECTSRSTPAARTPPPTTRASRRAGRCGCWRWGNRAGPRWPRSSPRRAPRCP